MFLNYEKNVRNVEVYKIKSKQPHPAPPTNPCPASPSAHSPGQPATTEHNFNLASNTGDGARGYTHRTARYFKNMPPT